MVKWCTNLLQISILVVLLGFLGIIALVTLVDPNSFKNSIENQVSSLTSRTLTFNGSLRWRLTHGLSIETSDVALSNRAGFDKTFLSIQKMQITPRLWSLFTGRLLVDIVLQDADLNLIRKSPNVNNWQDLFESSDKKSRSNRIVLNRLEIKQCHIDWQDEYLKRHYSIRNLSLNSGSLMRAIRGKFTNATLSFFLTDPAQKQEIQASLNADWKLKDTLKTLELQNLNINGVKQDAPPISLVVTQAQIQDFKNNPALFGNMSLALPDLNAWLDYFKIKTNLTLPKNIDLKAEFKYISPQLEITSFLIQLKPRGSFEGNLQMDSLGSLKDMNATGSVKGSLLTIGSMDIPEVKATIQMKNGLLNINPIEYHYAKGDHRGSIQVDFTNPVTKYRFSQESNHFEISTLLETLGYHNKLQGGTSLKFNLWSEGDSLFALKQNLNGQGEFELNNGKIGGIDAAYLLKHAQNTIKDFMSAVHRKKPSNLAALIKSELAQWAAQSEKQQSLVSPFTQIKGSFSLSSGIITNPDLSIVNSNYIIHGKGSLSLSDENINYHLSGIYKDMNLYEQDNDIYLFLNQTPLLVHIQGPLQEPGLRPDFEKYAEQALKFSQRNIFEKFVDKNLDKLDNTLEDEF